MAHSALISRYVAAKYTRLSFRQIACFFGTTPTAIIFAMIATERDMKADPRYRSEVDAIVRDVLPAGSAATRHLD
jgi:hypothetical protein